MRPPRRTAAAGTVVVSPVGRPLTVTAVGVDPALTVRLAQAGVRVGATVTVLARTAGGGCVVVAGTGRVALDRTTAAAVRVQPVATAAVPA